MKKNIYEDFLVNKDEANIDEIQQMLEFSSHLGKQTFFQVEKFYKKGDETRLKEDYNLQNSGISYFLDPCRKEKLSNLKHLISNVKDLRNIFQHASYTLTETDIFDIKQYLIILLKIIDDFPLKKIPVFEEKDINFIADLLKLIDPDYPFFPTFAIYKNSSTKMKELIEQLESLETNKSVLEEDIIKSLKNAGLKTSFSHPSIYLKDENEPDKFSNDRIIVVEETSKYFKVQPKPTKEFIEIYDKINLIQNEIVSEKLKICEDLTKKIFLFKQKIVRSFEIVGIIDSYLAKITFAININGIVPEITEDELQLVDARNLILEKILHSQNLTYSPLNFKMNQGVAILTGSNMGGKTCSLKTIAQISYLVHSGLLVPAKKVSTPLFNGIYISKSATSFINEGLSSFGYELMSLKPYFDNRDNHYLFLLDEPASGTNPAEGKAIVRALALQLSNSRSHAVLSTHFDGISEGIECKKYCIKGFTEENIKKMSEYLDESEEISIQQIHRFIDHNLIEITTENQVPKNAITLLHLFKFSKSFIDLCESFSKE